MKPVGVLYAVVESSQVTTLPITVKSGAGFEQGFT